ncbi:hypothetical protein EYY87_16620 [Hafnia paralvei]|uniref:restriction endonuclease subunit S n=1 Tax=Hafnia paralvei TaxID=546367 RepID=UPI00103486C1|nr:restriction endonuclease subunit S [Hafnia paralvei]TBM02975.1 hypothetical protein EYY87_16620 [Hafnia paralvei]
MKLVPLESIFHIFYGVNLELNKLIQDVNGLNFVSRTAKNNGVSAKVKPLATVEPIPPGTITVAGGGSVLETFLQQEPFYSGRDLYCLSAIQPMSDVEKLYYCACIRANKYRYNYGRQANKTLRSLLVPDRGSIPKWVYRTSLEQTSGLDSPESACTITLTDVELWKPFKYSTLFELERGKGPRKKDLDGNGIVPFITSTDSNNGLTDYTSMEPCHNGNVITVNRNGSVGEAYYQPIPFCSTEDVHVFTPKFNMDSYIAMFLITLIRKEKFRFGYGRKWGLERMKNSVIRLPITPNGDPDWEYMRNFIKSLPFSSQLQ